MLIDTHCHLDFDRFHDDLPAVIARAAAVGVRRIIVPALHPDNWQAVLHLAENYESVYAALGVHPNSCADWDDRWLATLRLLARHEKCVAIGEIGLDYYWDLAPKTVQHRAFAAQLALAAELHLPAIVHNRESDPDLLRLLMDSPLAGRAEAGVLHSFAATWELAQQALAAGFYLGFTGPVTFKKADALRAVAVRVPEERILVETDAPFLTPHPYRGQRNEPAYVLYIAARLAAERGVSETAFAAQTTANAIRLFPGLGANF
ncbi:MAG: TatD family hydrolase [Ardenticatenales bacterium]|nr:TatD family hydrolase [Ardenticatenales bacterium]